MTTLERIHRLKEAIKLIEEAKKDEQYTYRVDSAIRDIEEFIATLSMRLKQ